MSDNTIPPVPSSASADASPLIAPVPDAKATTITTTSARASMESIWAKPAIGVYTLSLFLVGLLVAYLIKNDTAFNLMVGAIISNVTTVCQYYFGSSSGSDKKTDMLAGTPPPTTTTTTTTP